MREDEKAELVKWLSNEVRLIESTRDEIPFGLDYDGEMALKGIRVALASLMAEPVAWVTLQSGWEDKERTVITDEDVAREYSRDCYELTPLCVWSAPRVPTEPVYQERRYQFIGKRQLEYWADINKSTYGYLPESERRVIYTAPPAAPVVAPDTCPPSVQEVIYDQCDGVVLSDPDVNVIWRACRDEVLRLNSGSSETQVKPFVVKMVGDAVVFEHVHNGLAEYGMLPNGQKVTSQFAAGWNLRGEREKLTIKAAGGTVSDE